MRQGLRKCRHPIERLLRTLHVLNKLLYFLTPGAFLVRNHLQIMLVRCMNPLKTSSRSLGLRFRKNANRVLNSEKKSSASNFNFDFVIEDPY
jgi:hypothetical protein